VYKLGSIALVLIGVVKSSFAHYYLRKALCVEFIFKLLVPMPVKQVVNSMLYEQINYFNVVNKVQNHSLELELHQ